MSRCSANIPRHFHGLPTNPYPVEDPKYLDYWIDKLDFSKNSKSDRSAPNSELPYTPLLCDDDLFAPASFGGRCGRRFNHDIRDEQTCFGSLHESDWLESSFVNFASLSCSSNQAPLPSLAWHIAGPTSTNLMTDRPEYATLDRHSGGFEPECNSWSDVCEMSSRMPLLCDTDAGTVELTSFDYCYTESADECRWDSMTSVSAGPSDVGSLAKVSRSPRLLPPLPPTDTEGCHRMKPFPATRSRNQAFSDIFHNDQLLGRAHCCSGKSSRRYTKERHIFENPLYIIRLSSYYDIKSAYRIGPVPVIHQSCGPIQMYRASSSPAFEVSTYPTLENLPALSSQISCHMFYHSYLGQAAIAGAQTSSPDTVLPTQHRLSWVVPWLGFNHDDGSYPPAKTPHEYAYIRGWEENKLQALEQDLTAYGRDGLALLQSMLFFGILEVLGARSLHERTAVRRGVYGEVLTCEPAESILRSLAIKTIDCRRKKRHRRLLAISQSLHACRNTLRTWLNAFLHTSAVSRDMATLKRQISLLDEGVAVVFYQLPPEEHSARNDFDHLHFIAQPYQQLLQMSGHCPTLYSYLDYVGTSALEHFCITNSAVRQSDTSEDARHSECTIKHCLQTQNIPQQSFSSAGHVRTDCNCRQIKISTESIRQILDGGQYFLLDMDILLNEHLDTSQALVPYTGNQLYTAFSHVWSHGLVGSPETGFPSCQLKLLSNRITHLNSSSTRSLFWFDSLCIPRVRTLKMLSINLMDKIYSNASSVIALDRSLQKISIGDMDPEALALRILVSDWNTRLWTFQEAKLAKDLHIALKDGCISLQSLLDYFKRKLVRGHATAVTTSCLAQLSCLSSSATSVFDWLDLFQFRSCSVPSDEPLVISNLCGLLTARLTSLEGEARMAELWKMLGRVPSGLLFHASPKLQIEGYRWAPASLLCGSVETGIHGTEASNGKVTNRGLEVKFHVMELWNDYTLSEEKSVSLAADGASIAFRRRDRTWVPDGQDLVFDAIVLIRHPIFHLKVLPASDISAVALKRLDYGPHGSAPRYRAQHQLLGTVTSCEQGDESASIGPLREIIVA